MAQVTHETECGACGTPFVALIEEGDELPLVEVGMGSYVRGRLVYVNRGCGCEAEEAGESEVWLLAEWAKV